MFFHKDVLERYRKRVIRVRPDIADKWMVHHDNAPCHIALSVTEFFTSKDIPVVTQSPIHLTSAPTTFSFFINLKCPQSTSFRDFRKHPKECNGHAEDHTG